MFAIEGVPEIFIIFNNNILRLEYPQDASEVSGFTESHLITYLNSYINNILNQQEGGC